MSSQAVTTRFGQAAGAAAGAAICLVAILAMFSPPYHRASAVLFSSGSAARPAGAGGACRFTAEDVLGLFTIGLVSGTFGGMLGMGGGVLKMSFLLLFFGLHPGVSRFAALLSYLVVAAGASYRYLKLGFVMMDVVKILIPSSVVGIVLGAFVGHYLPRDVLTLMLGVFLLFIAVVMVRRMLLGCQGVVSPAGGRPARGRAAPLPAGWKVVVCGFPGGFLSAMLGISGGVVTNPLQQVLARIPIKNAIANTLVKASVTVPVACVMIMIIGVRSGDFDFWTPLLVAACLIPGALIGSQLGPALTGRMSCGAAHGLLGAVSLFMGINMLFFSG